MKTDTAEFGRPERFLLVIARGESGCRGKAVRISDGEELRFSNLDELKSWLESDVSEAAAPVRPEFPTL